MQLKTKFIIFLGAVVIISYGITFYRTSHFQEELVVDQTARQARMIHSQVLLTRQWVADHNGIFILKQPGVEANPFLDTPEIVISPTLSLVKRNPAMVTRELSEYSGEAGLWRYRVTSLDPINPANVPDAFEAKSLKWFDDGVSEVVEIEKTDNGRILRYIAPLYIEESCLECHGYQGYKVGDIRGGLSVSIPMEAAYQSIHNNNMMLLFIALLTIGIVAVTLFVLIDILVVRRIQILSREMDRFPEENSNGQYKKPSFTIADSSDEMGQLALKYQELTKRLTISREDLKKTQEQVFQGEKLAALGRLVAGVGHEINNPLGGMLNCVKSMQEYPEDRTLSQRYLALMDKGLNRIKHTVHQLLNFGRMEPLQLKEIDINLIINDCLELLSYGIKHIELKRQFTIDQKVVIDGEALRQVIMNLGINAIHAMPEKGVLAVRTWLERGLIHIFVSDTGVGIASEDLQRIFDPFFTTKEVGEGTGLGLSVSYSLIERMGGHISVESKEGEGTTFHIVIPDCR
jgi:signal transduction histidine kinase